MEEDKQQWLSIAAVVLVIVGLGYFLYRQSRQTEEPSINVEDIVAEERADELAESMNMEIPETADRANLKDVSGGAAAGLATRVTEDGNREYSVLAGLPEPDAGSFYAAYLVGSGEEDEVYMGKLTERKGGWVLDYQSDADLSGYSKVQVTQETVDDKESEEVMLEGEF